MMKTFFRAVLATLVRIDIRAILARLPLPLLALAASYGVYSYALLFVPQSIAIIQAAAFELTYIGLAVERGLVGMPAKRARLISVGAVLASIIYNTLAGWFLARPELLTNADQLAWLALAILHGAPLAWVAYLISDVILHAPDLARPEDAQAAARIAQLRDTIADHAEMLSDQAAAMQRDGADIARMRDMLAHPPAVGGADLLMIARRLLALGESTRSTAELLRMPESTLRSRLQHSNGVHERDI